MAKRNMTSKSVPATTHSRRQILQFGAATAGLLAMPSYLRASSEISGELTIDMFGGAYIEAVQKHFVEPFEAETGVKVRMSAFGSGGDQLAKLQAGNDALDVSAMNGSRIYAAIKSNALLPINKANIPNFAQQHENFQNPAYEVGDGNNYSTALVWGDTAIAYNTDHISNAPTSWEDFMRPELKGRVSMRSSASSLIQTGAVMTGQGINNITDLDAIEAKLLEIKPQLLKYWDSGSEATQLFATGEIWIANFWRGRVNKLADEGIPVTYTVPTEGAPSWLDCMTIPKTCRNQPAAEAFINMTLDKDLQRAFVIEGINYAPSNVEVQLTAEEQARLGAAPEVFDAAQFPSSQYVAENLDNWTVIANRIKS